MFLKTLKHFCILKIKELSIVLMWIAGILILLLPGQLHLRRPQWFWFLPQHFSFPKSSLSKEISIIILGTMESVLFWLSILMAIFVLLLFYFGIKELKERFSKHGLKLIPNTLISLKNRIIYNIKELSLVLLCFPVGCFVILKWLTGTTWLNSGGEIVAKYIVLTIFSSILGALILIVVAGICMIFYQIFKFLKNNWLKAEELAKKECNVL